MTNRIHQILFWLLILSVPRTALAADEKGFVPLFNGRNLSGWVNANCAPETWTVHDGMIHCTGLPTGALRTARQYENFILEVEWRHLVSGGNSGVFIWGTPIAAPGVPFLRGIEVQVLDHGYNVPGKNEWYTTNGDVFPIHGATMKPFGRHNGERSFPSEERGKGFPEWNHYRIVCSNGVIRLHVNGKEVSGGEECSYRKGYLALESEGAPVDFRNIRIKELPPSGALPELTAPVDLGWHAMFTGVDLRGWRTPANAAFRWRVSGERLVLPEGAANGENTLWTQQEFGNAEFVLDCRSPKPISGSPGGSLAIQIRGGNGLLIPLPIDTAKPSSYNRFVITVRGSDVTVRRNSEEIKKLTLMPSTPKRGPFGLLDGGGALEFMNFYVRTLR